MNAKDAIRNNLKLTEDRINVYLSDLSDADLLVRPVPNANHIAWQLGHVIASERRMLATIDPNAPAPDLPPGFMEQHAKETAHVDPPKGFGTKEQYLQLFRRMRSASLEALAALPEADLDRPVTGNVARMAPTVGAVFLLMANHSLMHGGQFSVVRRHLGKPVLF